MKHTRGHKSSSKRVSIRIMNFRFSKGCLATFLGKRFGKRLIKDVGINSKLCICVETLCKICVKTNNLEFPDFLVVDGLRKKFVLVITGTMKKAQSNVHEVAKSRLHKSSSDKTEWLSGYALKMK